MVIFHSYVNVYQGVTTHHLRFPSAALLTDPRHRCPAADLGLFTVGLVAVGHAVTEPLQGAGPLEVLRQTCGGIEGRSGVDQLETLYTYIYRYR